MELRCVRTRSVAFQQQTEREHAGVVGTGAFFGEKAGASDLAGQWFEVLQSGACAGFGGVGSGGGVSDA